MNHGRRALCALTSFFLGFQTIPITRVTGTIQSARVSLIVVAISSD